MRAIERKPHPHLLLPRAFASGIRCSRRCSLFTPALAVHAVAAALSPEQRRAQALQFGMCFYFVPFNLSG